MLIMKKLDLFIKNTHESNIPVLKVNKVLFTQLYRFLLDTKCQGMIELKLDDKFEQSSVYISVSSGQTIC